MRIKTYVVDNVSEAYPLIQNDLGKDAFILKTKPLKKSGFLGLFQKRQFEVVAASDDSNGTDMEIREPFLHESEEHKRFEDMIDSLVPKSSTNTAEQDHAQKILEALKNHTNASKQLKLEPVMQNQPFESDSLKVQEQIATAAETLENPSTIEPFKPMQVQPTQQDEQPNPVPKKRGRPKKSEEPPVEAEKIQDAPKKKRGRPKKVVEPISEEQTIDPSINLASPKKSQEELISQASHQEVLKELSEVKGLIQAMTLNEQPSKMIPRLLEKWVEKLRDHEVDEEIIQFIMKKVSMIFPNLEAISTAKIEQTILEVIEQLFQEGIDSHSSSAQSFIALVGPTGVGKTTTIAKLAAAQVIGQRQKVGLLTTDTFRIAAVEQLKTYAGILNVPFKVVDQASKLVPTMQTLNGCDIVYMDSAGRNYLEGEYIEEINQYLRLDVPQENYLVLSMTTRWRDMKKIVEQMKAVPIDKLILTKWDETTCFGVALNMVYHYPYPLSYLCFGQGVPQDIMKADPTFMAKKLLGVDDSETGSSTSLKTII